MNISILANVSSLQFLDAFPTQESIEQNRRLLSNLHQCHIEPTQWPLAREEQANLQRRTLTPRKNDVTTHDEYQADINDLENIEPDHHERLRDLTHEIDHL